MENLQKFLTERRHSFTSTAVKGNERDIKEKLYCVALEYDCDIRPIRPRHARSPLFILGLNDYVIQCCSQIGMKWQSAGYRASSRRQRSPRAAAAATP